MSKKSKVTLNTEDVWIEKADLLDGGAKGMSIVYAFTEEYAKNSGVANRVKLTKAAAPDQDLIDLIKSLRYYVSTIINLSYARKLTGIAGLDFTDVQVQGIDGIVREAMEGIEVTGIEIKEKGNSDGMIIHYKQYDMHKKRVVNTKTTWVSFEADEYQIEEDLEEVAVEIRGMCKKYLFEQFYQDSAQLAVNFPDLDHDDDEEKEEESETVEDAEVVE